MEAGLVYIQDDSVRVIWEGMQGWKVNAMEANLDERPTEIVMLVIHTLKL